MASSGHKVLRLPPYHSGLNPIELIRADVKQCVGADNTTFRISDFKHLCEQSFEETGADKWISFYECVEKLEKQCYEQEGAVETD